MPNVDLNCDMGESSHLYPYSIEKDVALLQYISSVNLACGFHAGDAHTMHQLVQASLERHIAVGAHPGFPDKENFGRKDMQFHPEVLYDMILYQLGALQSFLKIYRSKLHHVKPHGALYNMASKQRPVADIISNAVKDFDDSLILYGLSGSEMITSAEDLGLKTCCEVFADRTYLEDGSLTPRSGVNAILEDENAAIAQALQIVQEGIITATTGQAVKVKADTICIHGDGKHALAFAKAIHETFKRNNVRIQQP